MSHSSRCVADTVVALLFIPLMTNDFESIFHGCKILAVQKKVTFKKPSSHATFLSE